MSKAASHFRENDVKRLVRSVERAGVKIGRVELQGGRVVLFPADGATETAPKPEDSLDNWMANRAHSTEGR
jgi:hypothetical protein